MYNILKNKKTLIFFISLIIICIIFIGINYIKNNPQYVNKINVKWLKHTFYKNIVLKEK